MWMDWRLHFIPTLPVALINQGECARIHVGSEQAGRKNERIECRSREPGNQSYLAAGSV